MDSSIPIQTQVAVRLVLYRGETHRLARSCTGVRVREGMAWVSYAGSDLILGCGQKTLFQLGTDYGVVSSIGASPLVIEVLERSRHRSYRRQASPESSYVPG